MSKLKRAARLNKKQQIVFSSVLGIILLLVIFWPKKKVQMPSLDEVEVVDSVEVVEITYKYGIPLNNYEVDYGVVKQNQSLSTILTAHGLTIGDVYRLSTKSKKIFDVKKIRSGQSYAVFSTVDSLHIPEFFVYEMDARSYVVFDLRGEYEVKIGENPVEWRMKEARGKIETSLWNAMSSCQTEPFLAVELARIFGWTIDFFGLRKNDEFRVIYEQECIDDKELTHFRILAAVFVHADSAYYAIPFKQDGETLYYNEKGNSLEGAFLKAPLDYFRITSRFSNSRYHPVLKINRPHHGVDYAAPVGTPVYAIGDGTVIAKGFQSGGGGNYIKIKHNSTYTTTYMHLSKFAKGLSVGSRVRQKEVIGYVGSSGLSTGPHLDFRVYENGKPIDPLKIKSQPKKPVSEANQPQFMILRDSLLRRLQQIPEVIG